jgi:hypothetical protein
VPPSRRTRDSDLGPALLISFAVNAAFWAVAAMYGAATGSYEGGETALGWGCMCGFNAMPGLFAALIVAEFGGGPVRSAIIGALPGLTGAALLVGLVFGLGGPFKEAGERDMRGLVQIGVGLVVKESLTGAAVGLFVGLRRTMSAERG